MTKHPTSPHIVMDSEEGIFGLRVAGLMLKDDKILLSREEHDDLWVLPGGGVHLHESIEDALIREFKEESEIHIEVNRLLWIVENFFESKGDNRIHSLEFIFLVTPKNRDDLWQKDEFYGKETDVTILSPEFLPAGKKELKLVFRWFTPEEMKNIQFVPKIMTDLVQNIPDSTEQISFHEY